MATQYDIDIAFSTRHEQHALKILELPPELLALLESDNPPQLTISSALSSNGDPGYAILSSGDKNYQMRQKNTSNPIMILQPSSTGPTEADDASTFIPAPSICSIASIEDTIELILQEPEGVEKAPVKVNKWHEKFAKSRAAAKPKD
ncbi:hypothetical protein B7494_g117 [Chlorociboria aeruginascens]|nr:hypothetical protein B7494_g117 [Chlorociboria aeruginascens]